MKVGREREREGAEALARLMKREAQDTLAKLNVIDSCKTNVLGVCLKGLSIVLVLSV